jgi:hypothetical protein
VQQHKSDKAGFFLFRICAEVRAMKRKAPDGNYVRDLAGSAV